MKAPGQGHGSPLFYGYVPSTAQPLTQQIFGWMSAARFCLTTRFLTFVQFLTLSTPTFPDPQLVPTTNCDCSALKLHMPESDTQSGERCKKSTAGACQKVFEAILLAAVHPWSGQARTVNLTPLSLPVTHSFHPHPTPHLKKKNLNCCPFVFLRARVHCPKTHRHHSRPSLKALCYGYFFLLR